MTIRNYSCNILFNGLVVMASSSFQHLKSCSCESNLTVNLHVATRTHCLLFLRVTSMNWNTAQKTSLEIIRYEIRTFLTYYSYTKALTLG